MLILVLTVLLGTEHSGAQSTCDTTYLCRSIVTDTMFNPYVIGVLGNPRPNKTYAYYTERTEQNTGVETNIRTDGTISSFVPFWTFQGNGITPKYDAVRWYNSTESTLYNKKGLELENVNIANIYSAALYGYDYALPVAVVQNAKYREVAFEGFEDYDFGTAVCDPSCPVGRHFDWSGYKTYFDTAQSHTGRYSLRVNGNTSIGMAAQPYATDVTSISVTFNLGSNCQPTQFLKKITTTKNALLPVFAPAPSKDIVISAWVKEAQDCKCTSYTNNQIVVVVTTASGNITTVATPSGNIIDGWQRYEQTVNLPPSASNISFSFKATSSTTVYFDDIRIHPFNAGMKSFVYDSRNLRLMAELDNNNYATFYEYDDDGTLVRVKKETDRGVKTIKETRSALLKEQVQ